jgi:hypothetical protein
MGGEELGGTRSLHHYMQRTALQDSPAMLTDVTASWIKGAPTTEKEQHPFRFHFEDLDVGQTFFSRERTITLEDIEHFAHFTGDTFYATWTKRRPKGTHSSPDGSLTATFCFPSPPVFLWIPIPALSSQTTGSIRCGS